MAKLKRAIGGSLLSPSAGRRLSCSRLEPFGSRGQNLGEIRLYRDCALKTAFKPCARCCGDAGSTQITAPRRRRARRGLPFGLKVRRKLSTIKQVRGRIDQCRWSVTARGQQPVRVPRIGYRSLWSPRSVSYRRCARQSPTSRSGFLNLVLLADRGTNGIDRSVSLAAVALELHTPTLLAFRSRQRCRVKDTRSDIAPSDYALPSWTARSHFDATVQAEAFRSCL